MLRILCRELEMIQSANLPKIVINRRNSTGKTALERDDLFTMLTFLDENKLFNQLPVFVADDPDKLPLPKIMEGDLEGLWKKLTNLDNKMIEANHSISQCSDNMAITHNKILRIQGESKK